MEETRRTRIEILAGDGNLLEAVLKYLINFFMGLFGYDCIIISRRNYSIMPSKCFFVSLKNPSLKFLRYISKQPLRVKKMLAPGYNQQEIDVGLEVVHGFVIDAKRSSHINDKAIAGEHSGGTYIVHHKQGTRDIPVGIIVNKLAKI